MYIEPYYVRRNTIETANRYQLSRPYNLIFTARSENPKARIVLKVFYIFHLKIGCLLLIMLSTISRAFVYGLKAILFSDNIFYDPMFTQCNGFSPVTPFTLCSPFHKRK